MFKHMKIGMRLWLLVLVAITALIFTAAQSLLNLRHSMLEDRQTKTRHVVETAYGVMSYYGALSATQKISPEEARTQAINILRSMRYEEKEYFWVNTLEPRMVMHPMKPELDGKDLSGLKDPNGKLIFVEFANTAKHGGGFVDYFWPKPGSDKPVAKISYVKQYEPWGLVIGSGIYLDDVDSAFMREVLKLGGFAGGALLIIGFSAWVIARSITRPLNLAMDAANKIAAGDLSANIQVDSKDETGQLLVAMKNMNDTLKGLMTDTDVLVKAAAVGDLNTRADASKYQGDFRKLVQGVNDTVTNIAEPMKVTSDYINQIAKGVIPAQITTAYQG
ncbi:MAG TPA: cache domain-containing protein, partial [Gallionella sp.]|nr:cache domain-containing protein [Gallionella sp.]